MSPLEVPARIPPHNLDAERAVLGAVLLEGREALPRVVEVLRRSDFYTEAHRALYQAMLALFDRGAPVDSLTLSEELRRTDQLQFVGGPAAIALLMEEASIAAHLGSYTAIVRDMAVLRELIQTSTHIIGQAFDAKEDVQTLVDDAEKRIFSLAERRLEGSALPVGKILKNTFEYIERLYERKEHVTGVATGFEKLDLETSGFQPSDFIIIAGRPSMGKAQPLDARVRTPTGWKRMGDLRVGDALASIDGHESVVHGVFPQGHRQVYRITFSDGRSTECCAEHLWRVHHRAWPAARVLSTAQIAVMLARKHYRHSLCVDTPSGDDGHTDPLPVDPWLLGALLGAGELSGGALRFWTSDPELLARVTERADGQVAPTIIDALRRLGVWDVAPADRFVPDIYLDARRAARVDLLRGLLDAAGVVEPRALLRLTATSGRLARAVAALVRSLGGWCSVRRRSTRTPFVCTIDYREPKELLTVSSKLVRTLTPRRPRRPVFAAIEPTRVAETRCIAVTHPSALYITDDHVVTHNTAFALNIVQHVGVNLRGTALVLSLEMSAQQLVQRMLCSEAKVDSQAVRTGFLSSSDWHRLTAAAGRLSEAKIFIDDSPGLTVLEARAKARRMKAEHGLDLLVIDYLQLMRGRAALDNRQQEISEISRSLKALAKELNVPVVALSQLSRAVEARAQRDFRPQLSDLRECVAGETLVLLADGRRVPIRDLVETAPEVLAISAEGKIVVAKSDRVWRVGTRPILTVRLASGRTLRTTARHRLFSARGWLAVEELRVGDRLAIARSVPEPLVPERWPDRRVALLGQLIGGGSYLRGQPLRYTTSSEANSVVVTDSAREEFGATVTRYAGRGCWHQLLISGNGNRWHPGGVGGWLQRLGIHGQRSHRKRIPEAVFRLAHDQSALLLRHLWATGGTIAPRRTNRGSHAVHYSTNSAALAADIAALLLRLGIVARITTAKKTGYRPGYRINVSGAPDQRRFLEVVGAFGPRVPQAQRLAGLLEHCTANTNVDAMPIQVFELKTPRFAQGISHRRMAALRGTAYEGGSHFQFASSRIVMREYAELLHDDGLRRLTENDLFWDRIVAIEPSGHEDVFDITVPGLESWLADGIVSHNSGALEQDSDVILFLYRARVYREDVPPEEENIAEVIIGKQRNGPIGTVKVVFLPQYARFENAAEQHRQPSPF